MEKGGERMSYHHCKPLYRTQNNVYRTFHLSSLLPAAVEAKANKNIVVGEKTMFKKKEKISFGWNFLFKISITNNYDNFENLSCTIL